MSVMARESSTRPIGLCADSGMYDDVVMAERPALGVGLAL